MKERPTSITVIAWILIAIGVLNFILFICVGKYFLKDAAIVKAMMVKNGEWMKGIKLIARIFFFGYGLLVFDGISNLVIGIAMLKRRNWARFLYVIFSIACFLRAFITKPSIWYVAVYFVFFLVSIFFLFRPKAGRYFTADEVVVS